MTRTSEPLAQGRTPRTDEELLAAVRAGQPDAFPDLRDRHWHTAVVVARLHTPSRQDAEQLAGTAVDQVLAEIGGADPGADTAENEKKAENEERGPTEDSAAHAAGGSGRGVFLRARLVAVVGRAGVEREPAAETVAGIFLRLSASWQAVLWHLEIEALDLERTAAVLGLSPAATTALHLEARAGLRAAYRRARLELPGVDGCSECAADLGAFADGGLSAERTQAVQSHLAECARCTADHLYLQDTEAGLRGWLLPVLAGVPLWDTRTDEVVELVRTAGRISAGRLGAAPGTDVAGGALAAVHVSRRGRKVLLGAGALAAAAALAGVAVTGSGGFGDGTTQAMGGRGGSGTTATVPSPPPASSGAADSEQTPARGPGPAAPAGGDLVLSLPTSEPSAGPLTEDAAEARTARASSGTIVTAATAPGRTAGAREAGEGSGGPTGRGTAAGPGTQRSTEADGRAPRPTAAPADEAGSPGPGSPAGGGADGGSAAAPPAQGGGTPTGGSRDEQPPATAGPGAPAPGAPAPGTPAPGTPAPETPAPETPAPGTPAPEDPVAGTPGTQPPASGAPVLGSPATEAPGPDAPGAGTPGPTAPVEAPPEAENSAAEAPAAETPASGLPASQPPATGAPAAGTPAPGGDGGGPTA
ncbi:zf-HC2 domain-containing protein [Kocuria sp. CPCC 205268]|uniref:zf-HC2 domain-containing protein n=1 Tax=Kocuria oxytropis TaxID=3058913 RepID=UPI0034D571EC